MDSLLNILSSKDFKEPEEMTKIKAYVKREYGATVGVMVRERDVLIIVPNSALANTLRLRGPEIKQELNIDKRLTYRIGK